MILQLSAKGIQPHPVKKTVAERTAILNKIAELNIDKNGEKGDVLFMSELAVFHRNVGRVLYPDLVDAIQSMGFGTVERPEAEWTPENLKQYKMVVLSEACSNPYAPSRMGNARLKKLIADNNLPSVVTHSLRHTSVTYKLKLNGGDIKATQGDSGHSQANMILNVYSHILDDDRRKNAELFEKAFYEKKELNPDIHRQMPENMLQVPEGVNAELLEKVLANPEMAALLASMAKTLE